MRTAIRGRLAGVGAACVSAVLAGPALVGPALVGPALVGPALVGPGLVAAVPTASAVGVAGDERAGRQVDRLEQYWKGSAGGPAGVRGTGPVLRRTVLAKAAPDECFAGVGQPYPQGTRDADGRLICPADSQPKVNQAYVWGLAKAGDDLWFGTGPNIHCLVLGSYLGTTESVETRSYVCEGARSTYRTEWLPGATLPAVLGDFRPPDLFVFDQATGTLVDKVPSLDAIGRARLHATLGIRSAGAIGDRVFLAGPALPSGLNVFVFDSDGSFVGSQTLPTFTNIRKWVEVRGHLYTGVGTAGGGQVLRYTGSTPADPFQYEVVGTMTSEPAELAEHDGRLFASTWPAADMAGLWMSPPIGSDRVLDAGSTWTQVWRADDYEPDPVTAATYGGGALVSYLGRLYWGTMHVPFTAALAHRARYGASPSTEAALANILGSHRAISLFRGDDFGTRRERVELLYGAATLPVYDGTTWTMQPNAMGVAPKFGRSGFGNLFNNYTWTMGVYRKALYVGTMDWSYLIADGVGTILPDLGVPAGTALRIPRAALGADLWRIPTPSGRAVAESVDGVGNRSSYGIRTMVADDALYLGMANPMNLLTDPTDSRPEGGWELLRLVPRR